MVGVALDRIKPQYILLIYLVSFAGASLNQVQRIPSMWSQPFGAPTSSGQYKKGST